MINNTVKFKKIHPDAVLPKRSHDDDAGYDLVAVSFEKKDFTVIASTGLTMELPPGYEAQIRTRSGLGSNAVIVANSPGTIDPGYRGEIKVILGSLTGQAPFLPQGGSKVVQCGTVTLHAGDRVAQMVFSKLDPVNVSFDEVNEESQRGTGGLGSTGE